MPQMSPLQWETLFIFSLMSIAAMTCKLFFSLMFSPQQPSSEVSGDNCHKGFKWLW